MVRSARRYRLAPPAYHEPMDAVHPRGASPQYAGMYARVFGRTTKLLPNFGNHLAPDAMHILIDVFVIAVIGTVVPYLRSLQSQDTPIVIRGSA